MAKLLFGLALLGTLLLGLVLGAFLAQPSPSAWPQSRRLQTVFTVLSGSEVASLQESDDLILKTKTFLKKGSGYYSAFDKDWYSQDYVFRGSVIGPFNVEDEEKVLTGAAIYEAFPDIDPGVHSCWFDVSNDHLVYCVLYPTGTHKNDWHSPAGLIKASNNTLESSGEVWSVLWDENGKVKHQTVGYPINAHRGNGCGFGALFALTCAAKGGGKLTYDALVAAFISEWTLGIPNERSTKVPDWWKSYCQGSNCP